MTKDMVTKYFLLFITFLLITTVVIEADNKFTLFEAGKHDIDFSFYSSIFTGIGAKSRNWGNTISSSINSPSLVTTNPAGLGLYDQNKFSIDFAPKFLVDIKDIYSGFQDKIDEQVDSIISDMRAEGMEPTYPDIDAKLGQKGWFNGLAASFTNDYFNWGITFHHPLILNMDVVSNDISIIIQDSVLKNEGQSDEYVERTTVPLDIELFSDVNINFSQVDFGFGKKFYDKYSAGIGLNVLRAKIGSNLDAKINGIIRQRGGDTDINVAFNDPNVAYRNTLNDTVNINFDNILYGGKLGFSYLISETMNLDAILTLPKKAKLDGNLHIVQHTLGALDLNYDEDAGEELFDIELLKPSKIAFTNRTIYDSDELELSLPGNFGVCFSYQKNNFTGILSYEKPFSEFSFHYECKVYEDGLKKEESSFVNYSDTTHKSYTIGLKPKHNLKFAVGYKNFALSGQLFVADQILDGVTDSDGNPSEPAENFMLGSLALGFGCRLYENLSMDMNVLTLPSPLLRTTLTYKFN